MQDEKESDEALVERAGKGDAKAAALLVARHTDKIYAVCFRMLSERAAAEDATQETFLRLWRNAKKWKPRGAKFETWLYRVAMNICYDHFRKTRRDAPEDAAPEMVDPDDRPDQALLAGERRLAVDDALEKLPDRQRMAITLCHYQELSNIEAAEIMDVSVEAIESLLARARRNLRDRLLPMKEHLTGVMHDDANPTLH